MGKVFWGVFFEKFLSNIRSNIIGKKNTAAHSCSCKNRNENSIFFQQAAQALDPVLFLVEVPNPAQNVGLEKGPDFAPIPVSALIQLALLPIQIFVMACD